ncbi:MAG: hypothetical protein ACREJU_04725 [Nitrospiraceae bacterium]
MGRRQAEKGIERMSRLRAHVQGAGEWARRLYQQVPWGWDRAAASCLPLVLPWSAVRVPVAILTGRTKHSERQATIIVAGARPWAEYLPHRFFASRPQREVVAHVPVWMLPSTLRRLGASADMTIARVDRLSARMFFEGDELVVPESIPCRIAAPVDVAQLARASKSVKEDLRTLRREKMTSEVSHSEADFEVFYHTMYEPLMRKRHADFAVIHNPDRLRRAFRHGGLIWVRRGGQRVAGGIFEQRNDELRFLSLGTADGDPALVKAGALAALYVFEIACANERGCAAIDFGGSPPILNDGLLRYKLKWGIRIGNEPQTPFDYVIRWRSVNDHVLNFLAQTPLICRVRGRLAGITAIGSDQVCPEERAAALCRSLWIPGLDRLFVLVPGGAERRPALGAASGRAVLCNAERFLRDHGVTGTPVAESEVSHRAHQKEHRA